MSGFDNEVLYADNVDFSGNQQVTGQFTTDGQMLIGSTTAPNIRVGTLSSSGGSITFTAGSGTLNVAVTSSAIAGQLLKSGGIGVDPSYTTATYPSTAGLVGKIIKSNGTNWVGSTETYADPGTSGNILTSDGTNWTSAAPAPSGMSWSVITADQNITVGNGYICNKAGLLTLTLPASPTAGNLFSVTGMNTALGWKIAQNANQQIFIGTSSTTIGAGGSLASINIRDSADFVCVVGGASAVWNVTSSVGNLTIV